MKGSGSELRGGEEIEVEAGWIKRQGRREKPCGKSEPSSRCLDVTTLFNKVRYRRAEFTLRFGLG
jgi:hypothetical protein